MKHPMNRAEFRNADTIASGDTYNEIRVRLLDQDGKPVNLTGKTVTWSAETYRKRIIHGRAAAAYTNGEVGIKFLTADNLPEGPLYLNVYVTGSGLTEAFPAYNDLILKVKKL